MMELHASKTVAAKVTEKRQELGWSMRELAERSGLSEDVIEAIENDRRKRGVTVDEVMVLAHALGTAALILLPRDSDYDTDEQRQQAAERDRQREASGRTGALPRLTESLARLTESLAESQAREAELAELFAAGAVLAVERDGRLVPVEEPPGFLDGDLGLGGADVPLDHADVGPAA